ncbi:MAG: hypothetical protein QG661_849 [Actinomycetota bacterium]|nr:hypothetical protein [Actinomycetota bacterium]
MSPLSATLSAIEQGATTRGAIAQRTGLDPDVVDAAVEHLLRIGKATSPSLKTACPSGGCSGCGSPTGSGCATTAAPGPVAVTIRPAPVSSP